MMFFSLLNPTKSCMIFTSQWTLFHQPMLWATLYMLGISNYRSFHTDITDIQYKDYEFSNNKIVYTAMKAFGTYNYTSLDIQCICAASCKTAISPRLNPISFKSRMTTNRSWFELVNPSSSRRVRMCSDIWYRVANSEKGIGLRIAALD